MIPLPKQQKTPSLTGHSVDEKRAELKRYFDNSWQSYESLFSLINNDEAYFLRPEPLRHPLIFYYGHTATFYINKLILGKYIHRRVNEKLEAICAVGVDEMSWDDLDSKHYDWPSVDEVRSYRQQVYQLIIDLIDEMPLSLPITQDSLAWVILMGCEHERIHIETSSVIMRMLPLDCLTPAQGWQACPYSGLAPENELVAVAGKQVSLGKQPDDHTYGWDNEYGHLEVEVADFNASKYLVSNQEFLTFVEQGGYQNSSYWTEEGQQWLAYKQATMPRFWQKKQGKYFQRNLLEEIPLPLNWPVEVNYLEAKAFCQWKRGQSQQYIRLPTEAEWYCLRDKIPQDLLDWQEAPGNVNLEYFASSTPVDRFEHQGLYDICGNVWQWTESAIDGFNGFKVHPLYDDFSTPTFDGKHNLIKGGSWISTGNEAIKSSRYAFRRHFFQHAGFRYIESESADEPIAEVNGFESDTLLCRELELHYGAQINASEQTMPQALAQYLVAQAKRHQCSLDKVLNLGCSVGGTAFALSPFAKFIDALDFSARFIQYGVKLQKGEALRYQKVVEGDIVQFVEVEADKVVGNYQENILFSQGDAVNLKPIFTDYDVILLQQVLEHSYDPKKVLQQLASRLKPQGLVVIVSDYVFDEQITEKSKWLGGVKVNGENMSGFDGLTQQLANNFKLVDRNNITQRVVLNERQVIENQLDVTVWQRYDG